MSEAQTASQAGPSSRKRKVLRIVALSALALVLVVGVSTVFIYRHLNDNITEMDITEQLGADRPDKVDLEGPQEPLNVLVMGSDTRNGKGNNIDGLVNGGQRSDTTILMHLSADRESAYGVSLPRDAMVQRPSCMTNDGKKVPASFSMFNEAFSVAGPGCTVKTVEQLTGIRIDHFVVVDFTGFKDMVDAIGGVEVCIPEDVNDTTGNIQLEAGTREVQGQEALDYVRVRYAISENGDIGRMKRQQSFLAAMSAKVVSAGTLANPIKLVRFLDAATKSLTVDPGLANLRKLGDMGGQFQDIGLENIQFITVPFKPYPPDPNRLVWTKEADKLWKSIEYDEPLSRRLGSGAITAKEEQNPGSTGKPGASESPSAPPPQEPSQAAEAEAAENGLCA